MANSLLTRPNHLEFDQTLDDAFPDVEPGQRPFGSVLLVQIRRPKSTSKGGILVPEEIRATEYYNTQVAKVIAIGPICFMDRKTMEVWPEGAWSYVGDFVYVPKHGGVRFEVKHTFHYPATRTKDAQTIEEGVVFMYVKDTSLLGQITGDPLRVKAFLD